LPEFIGKYIGTVMYADDLGIWAVGKNAAEVAKGLESAAGRVTDFTGGNGLHLNAGKTQLMFSGRAGNVDDVSVNVDGTTIRASSSFELLGVKFNRWLTTAQHDLDATNNARQRAYLVARLAHHLPRGHYLRTLASGLVLGKIAHAFPAVATPRLSPQEAQNSAYAATQVAVNDVARTITGTKRSDHVRLDVLLRNAGIPSLNHKLVKAVAMETWAAYHSTDGVDGARNPVGSLLFGYPTGRTSRATVAGIIPVPMPGSGTFTTNAARIWNASKDL
jgi:hypothetical protein